MAIDVSEIGIRREGETSPAASVGVMQKTVIIVAVALAVVVGLHVSFAPRVLP